MAIQNPNLLLQFARLYPLDQKDMGPALRPIDFGVLIPSKVEVETSAWDYTPSQYLSLLFTDLGVLTPSAMGEATSDREGKICDWAHPEDSTESIDLAKREE
nr:translation initiation factor eIF-2B subunit alpha [Ipomoea batatas]